MFRFGPTSISASDFCLTWERGESSRPCRFKTHMKVELTLMEKIFYGITTNEETVGRFTETAHFGRFGVRLPREGDPTLVWALQRDSVGEVSGAFRGAQIVAAGVQHRVGDVLENVQPKDLAVAWDGPVSVEQRRTVMLDDDPLYGALEKARGVRLPQVRFQPRQEASPRTHAERAAKGAKVATGLVLLFLRQWHLPRAAQRRVLAPASPRKISHHKEGQPSPSIEIFLTDIATLRQFAQEPKREFRLVGHGRGGTGAAVSYIWNTTVQMQIKLIPERKREKLPFFKSYWKQVMQSCFRFVITTDRKWKWNVFLLLKHLNCTSVSIAYQMTAAALVNRWRDRLEADRTLDHSDQPGV